ncbi:MAG: hypothetical protein HYT62_00675 [Candidatus Yanofskybacteria bacterium]|nr:hypothetical protein [Candidatus Yanofskybacteria bacterium]
MKFFIFFKSRSRIIRRYLAIKKENDLLREKVIRLERQLTLTKLQVIAVRKKILP